MVPPFFIFLLTYVIPSYTAPPHILLLFYDVLSYIDPTNILLLFYETLSYIESMSIPIFLIVLWRTVLYKILPTFGRHKEKTKK